MEELLTLCTKNVHFKFVNQVYQQNDGLSEMEALLRLKSIENQQITTFI